MKTNRAREDQLEIASSGARNPIRAGFLLVAALGGAIVCLTAPPAFGYPPAVGILGQSRNCLACHANSGPWKDDKTLIIDIFDKATGKSLAQEDGTFLITAKRGAANTVLTVIGTAKGSDAAPPYRNAWLYIDPERINDTSSLNKFAPGWAVNLPMSCRLVGDTSDAYPDAQITVLPMTVRPGDDARDGEIELQFMLTKGESVKGKAKEGMVGNYFERKVKLTVEGSLAGAEWATQRVAVGDESPPFALPDAEGRPFDLAPYLGKEVLLLWFTNFCPGCQTGLPTLAALREKFKGRDLTIIAVAIAGEKDLAVFRRAMKESGTVFPILIDREGKIAERYTGSRPSGDVCPLTNFFVVDAQGRISFAGRFPGTESEELQAEVQKAFPGQEKTEGRQQ